jgi:5-methyltetrahydrofolate--homocysteine methyltransferase
MDTNLDAIFEAILNGDMHSVPEQVQAALDAGLAPESILTDGMIAAMAEVGSLFEEGEFFVPEMLIAARAMKAGLAVLKPHLVNSGVKPIGKVLIGTVKGDMHDIGKNLVAMMMEGAGFEVIDLGVDVSPQQFIDAIVEQKPDIVGLSALLTTTMPQMKNTISAVQSAGLANTVKFMVGGAPITAEFARQIGADGFATDASQATTLAKSFLAATT